MSLVLYNTNYSTSGYVVPDWGTCTDEELTTALQKHYVGEIDLHDHWKIEDEIVRPLTLSMGESIELVLMHPTYPLADGGTAAYAIGMKDCLNTTYPMFDKGVGPGWDGSSLRAQLNSMIYNQISESFRQNLKLMNIWTANRNGQSDTVGVYSQDYLALPAEKEIFGSNSIADSSIESQLFQFEWYKTAANRIKKVNGSNEDWWVRSRASSYDSSCRVDTSGTAHLGNGELAYGVSFFCAI